MDPVSVVGGLLLLFFAPGFLLLHALFPRRRWFGPFHPFAMPALSVVVSVALVVLVGSALAFLPGSPPGSEDGRGWFQGNQTGVPVLEVVFGGLCVALFAAAWWRGAFPLLGRAAPVTQHVERGEPEEITLLRDMRLEEERLRQEAKRIRRRAKASRDPGVQSALSEAADDLEAERRDLRARAADVERRAGERRYGVDPDPARRLAATRRPPP